LSEPLWMAGTGTGTGYRTDLSLAPSRPTLAFDVIGAPQTAGSKTAFVNPKTGKAVVTESGDRAAKRTWRGDVRDAAWEAIGALANGEPWPAIGPVAVSFTFRRARPKGHYGSGRNAGVLKPHAPRWPTTAPDALKLARALEDALTGVAYVDDAQIVDETIRKRYGPAGVSVEIAQLL
jgi:Holliday junction resolvase RusA-like endonuclease